MSSISLKTRIYDFEQLDHVLFNLSLRKVEYSLTFFLVVNAKRSINSSLQYNLNILDIRR